MTDPLYSLITIVNKEDVYQAFKAGLEKQTGVEYELIRINNENNEYNSARKAFNDAAKKAKGKYLVFLNPDIRFLNEHALKDVLDQIRSLPKDFGVAGIAGSPKELVANDRIILTTIIHGDHKEHVGRPITGPTPVQTLDECFFVISRDYWKKRPFPLKEGWHLYAVEQCLLAQKDQRENYVVPAAIWHTSDGKSEDFRYTLQVKQLIKEYQAQTASINTTVKRWPTRGLGAKMFVNVYLAKMYLKYLLKK